MRLLTRLGPVYKRLAANLTTLIVVVLAGGFIASALVRYSPGFDSIPEDLNTALNPETLKALHARHNSENSLPRFYVRYLAGAIRGDLGISQSLGQPVASLLRQRAPVTARLVLWGVPGGWLFAALLAWLAVWTRRAPLEAFSVSVSGLLLAIPPAVLGLAFFFYQAPLGVAISLGLLPRLFGTLRAIFEDCYASPALLAARSRGVGPARIAVRYVFGAAAPQLAALLGIAVVLAFGLAIPIEALCGVPGIGALTIQAATARDMPLLCALALAITFLVTFVQVAGDIAIGDHA
jgi:peptide/nickel transport system permease protein